MLDNTDIKKSKSTFTKKELLGILKKEIIKDSIRISIIMLFLIIICDYRNIDEVIVLLLVFLTCVPSTVSYYYRIIKYKERIVTVKMSCIQNIRHCGSLKEINFINEKGYERRVKLSVPTKELKQKLLEAEKSKKSVAIDFFTRRRYRKPEKSILVGVGKC